MPSILEMENNQFNNQNTIPQIRRSSEKTTTILLVDNDSTSLVTIAGLMRRCNYKVVTTRNAGDVFFILSTKGMKFDLVVADIHMPGIELQRLIHNEFQLPVVLISADEKARDLLKESQRSAVLPLLKPLAFEDVKNLWVYVEQWKNRKAAGKHKTGQSSGTRKDKIVWTPDLHARFKRAMHDIGTNKCVSKNILEMMAVRGLTRLQVGSHLQKYRKFEKQLGEAISNNFQPGHALNKLKQNKMWSLTFGNLEPDQLLGYRSNYPPAQSARGFSSKSLSSMNGANTIQMNPPRTHRTPDLMSSGHTFGPNPLQASSIVQTNNNGFFHHPNLTQNYFTGIGPQVTGSRNNPVPIDLSYSFTNGVHFQSTDQSQTRGEGNNIQLVNSGPWSIENAGANPNQHKNGEVALSSSNNNERTDLDELIAYFVENPIDEGMDDILASLPPPQPSGNNHGGHYRQN